MRATRGPGAFGAVATRGLSIPGVMVKCIARISIFRNLFEKSVGANIADRTAMLPCAEARALSESMLRSASRRMRKTL
jgi:hypothetical protein